MGTMGPHPQPFFFQNRPPGGGEMANARYFWMGHVAHVPEPKRVGVQQSNLAER